RFRTESLELPHRAVLDRVLEEQVGALEGGAARAPRQRLVAEDLQVVELKDRLEDRSNRPAVEDFAKELPHLAGPLLLARGRHPDALSHRAVHDALDSHLRRRKNRRMADENADRLVNALPESVVQGLPKRVLGLAGFS